MHSYWGRVAIRKKVSIEKNNLAFYNCVMKAILQYNDNPSEIMFTLSGEVFLS